MEQQDNYTSSASQNDSIDFIDQFVDGLHSDHLINLIRPEPPRIPRTYSTTLSVPNTIFHNSHLLVPGSFDVDHGLIGSFGPTPEGLFELVSSKSSVFDDPSSLPNSLSGLEDDFKAGEEDEDGDEDETDHSSATATTPTSGSKNPKLDRTRTLVSERKRRGRMKEKLYALRALVPNITKMDKASIVGDAVLYLQQLQMQAKKLKAEIAELESSLKDGNRCRGFVEDSKRNPIARIVAPAPKIIIQMDVFRVEEREFYIRLRTNKGQGVAISLYKALESLSNTIVCNSNLTTVCERFVLAFTINVGESQEGVNEASLKMWISRALVSQGFQLGTP